MSQQDPNLPCICGAWATGKPHTSECPWVPDEPDNELELIIGRYVRELYAAADDDIKPLDDFKQRLLAWRDKAIIEELQEAKKWATKAEIADQVWQQLNDRIARLKGGSNE